MNKYQLVIAHRVCPKLAKTAVGFSDKFEMVAETTRSLLTSLSGLRTKLFVILDGCDERYRELFSTNDLSIDVEIIETASIGNGPTFGKQIDILKTVANEADFLYFSEDDYFYAESAFREMMDILSHDDVDFVTPLDHPDRYVSKILESKNHEIKLGSSRHWRECSTTCLTFMMKANAMANCEPAFRSYANGNLDCTMWLAITQDCAFRFFKLTKNLFWFLTGKTDFNHILQIAAWKWSAGYLLTHKAKRLWSPIPSLATHLCQGSEPPFVTFK